MAAPTERSRLHVEGKDDDHAIRHLLVRHGIDYDSNSWPPWLPSIRVAGSREELLAGVSTAVSLSNGRSVGFVLDANSSLQDRWNAMASRLRKLGLEMPDAIPPGGFVGESAAYHARVGVWLMPDNERDGALEHFLETLVAESDPLIEHARGATLQAKDLGARFADNDNAHRKAVLHAWLAWQENPGLPYGSAIRARYFRHDSPVAGRFVAWFREVFDAHEATGDRETRKADGGG